MKLRCQHSLKLRHLLTVRPRPLLIASEEDGAAVSLESVDAESAVEAADSAAEAAVESEDSEDVEVDVAVGAVDGVAAAAAEDTDAAAVAVDVVAVETLAATDTAEALDATENR